MESKNAKSSAKAVTFAEARHKFLSKCNDIFIEKQLNRKETYKTEKRQPRTPAELKIDERDYTLVPETILYKTDRLGMMHPDLTAIQTDSAEDFNNGVEEIITRIFKVEVTLSGEDLHEDDDDVDHIDVVVRYTKVNFQRPKHDNSSAPLYPIEAHQMQRNYSGFIYVNEESVVKVYFKDDRPPVELKNKVKDQRLCRLPVPVGTPMCNTWNMSHEEKLRHKIDPDDKGYFIIGGKEWTLDSNENVDFNKARVFRNAGYQRETARLEFISSGGDRFENSDQLIIRMLDDGQLTVEIRRSTRMDSLSEVYIPFYVLFRAMGWTSDKEITEEILGFPMEAYSTEKSGTIQGKLISMLKKAFTVKYDDFDGNLSVTDPLELKNNMIEELVATEKFRLIESKRERKNAEADDEIPTLIVDKRKRRKKDVKLSREQRKHLRSNLESYFELHFLEHIGTTPDKRIEKLKTLADLLREVMLCAMGASPETGRDDVGSKRIRTNMMSLVGTFKTIFNLSSVYGTKRAIKKAFKNQPYEKVNMMLVLSSHVYGYKFEHFLIQAIKKAREEELRITPHRSVPNRLSSQILNRKGSVLNKIAAQRQINAPTNSASNASARALAMRQYTNTGVGFICPIASPEGQTVGVKKQLAYTANVTRPGDSNLLKTIILADPDITPISKVTPRMIYDLKLAHVYVNGHKIGSVKNAFSFAKKYRDIRRNCKIDILASIVWDPRKDHVDFRVDYGRPYRPLIIVYNTWDDPEKFVDDPEVKDYLDEPFSKRPFKQGIILTPTDIARIKAGQMTTQDLIEAKVIEYITPAEQSLNGLLACGPDILQRYVRDPTYRFTHLDLPQEMLSVTAMVAIYAHCNQTPRNVFENNQSKQTAGRYSEVWPYRCDKNTYIQYVNEFPLASTKINTIIPPNGKNIKVAIMCYTGYNQEDSCITAQGGIDRGAFDCSKFTSYSSELESNKQHFGQPDASNTRDMSPDASYSKLNKHGYVPVGTYITKNDVLICKLVNISEESRKRKYLYSAYSTVYKGFEDAIVYNVIIGKTSEGVDFISIGLRIVRQIQPGDKFSSRTGQKNINAQSYSDSNMPFTEDGVIPMLIMNPHAIPTRMTCGDLFEKISAEWCAIEGVHCDCSMFYDHNIQNFSKELEKRGIDPYCRVNLYNGFEGQPIGIPILLGLTFYQRLLKFVMDSYQTNSDGPVDPLTRQPVGGMSRDGGLRLGEMEKDCFLVHGDMRFLLEKFGHHSDGHPVYICRKCNQYAIVNHKKNIYRCNTCKDKAQISEVMSCWTSKLLFQEQHGMMLKTQLHLAPYTFDSYVGK